MAPTKELTFETTERTVKLIQEGNLQWSVAKAVGSSQTAVFKIWCIDKKKVMGA